MDRDFILAALQKVTAGYEVADEAERIATRDKAKFRAAAKALLALATEEPLEFTGSLADACRSVLRESETPLSPIETRNAIVALGYNLTQHKNPLASIHSVLKRLKQSGHLKDVIASTTTKDGMTVEKAAYQWVGNRPVQQRAPVTPRPLTIGGIGGVSADYLTMAETLRKMDISAGFDSMAKSIEAIMNSTDIAAMKRAIDAMPDVTMVMKDSIAMMNKLKP